MMKAITIYLILAAFFTACSTAGFEIAKARVKTVRRTSVDSKTESTEDVMARLARKMAAALHLESGRDRHVTMTEMSCFQDAETDPVSTYFNGSLRQQLLRYSSAAHFTLLKNRIVYPESPAGSPIARIDVVINVRCLPVAGRFKLLVELVDLQSSESMAVISESLAMEEWDQVKDFVVFSNRIFDARTGLYWERINNPTTYEFPTARAYCHGLIVDGMAGWRIPDRDELFTLVARPLKEKHSLLGYDYGPFWQEQGCHWVLNVGESLDSRIGIDFDTGKPVESNQLRNWLFLSNRQECRVKCVWSEPVKN